MRAATTLGAFALGLTAVFAASVGVGGAVGPVGTAADHGGGEPSAGGEHSAQVAADDAGGLAVSQDGYTLALATTTLAAGRPGPLRFTVLGPDGAPLTRFVREHDKDLHLVVVRRDATRFQHVHPTRDSAGSWTTELVLPDPGQYKLFADFVPAGGDRSVILTSDVTVAGAVTVEAAPAASRTAQVDGYTVELDGDLVAGQASRLVLRVSRAGQPVTDLQPYLAAYGHLVALRGGDLAYLHVHPQGEPGAVPAGPDITFYADVPTAGDYRLFLDFQHAGVVRTASFTVPATRTASAQADEDGHSS